MRGSPVVDSTHLRSSPVCDVNWAASFLSHRQDFVRMPVQLLKLSPRSPPGALVPKRNNNSSNSDSHAEERKYICDTCGDGFRYKHVLQNHLRRHTGEKPFVCPESTCNRRFTRDHHLKTHIRLHTGEKPFECALCGKKFVQVANLRRHNRVHTNNLFFDLKSCRERSWCDGDQLQPPTLTQNEEPARSSQTVWASTASQDEPEDLSLKNHVNIRITSKA